MFKIIDLETEGENEVYVFIDKYLRPLPKKSDGSIDKEAGVFQHNDVDALRHAYVSGIYTMGYNETVAAILGGLREVVGGLSGESLKLKSKIRNMDNWNNGVGRKYGKKSKTKEELFRNLLKALENGELITDLKDERRYSSNTDPKAIGRIIVLKESKTGENILFLDTRSMLAFSREDFVAKIKNGEYEDYEIRKIGGKEIPVSRRDGKDNLG